MSTFRYRAVDRPPDLEVGECVARRASYNGVTYWNLWFKVVRTDTGEPMVGRVPFIADGPQTGPESPWRLARIDATTWQVSPSIAISSTATESGEPHEQREAWHQTPKIIGVPEPAPWSGA